MRKNTLTAAGVALSAFVLPQTAAADGFNGLSDGSADRLLLAQLEDQANTSTTPYDVGISAGAHISTLGPGFSVSARINEYFGITGLINYLPYSTSDTVEDVSYEVDLQLLTIGAQADIYPLADSGLRLSAGAFVNQNSADLSARLTGTQTFEIGGTTYGANDVGGLDGSVDFDAIAPFVSVGYQAQLTSGLSISLDGGAVYQGSPDVALSARDINPALPAAARQQIADDIAREEQDAQSALDSFNLYPMVRASVSWRF